MSYTGVLELTATKKALKTILSDCYYEGALKITRPVYLDPASPSIYLIHIGGGYVDGDTYKTNIHVEERAELAVTTQSHTKVYKTPKRPVVQETTIKLGKGSVLEYMPDPLIAYEKARFIQETIVHIEEDSSFFYSDIITPGWAKDGSLFRYDWIRSKLKVYKGEKLVLFDHLMLEPDGEMNGLMQMDGYTHVGMFLILHEQVEKGFIDRLYEHLEEAHSDVRFGLSALPQSGVILRILARNTGAIEKMITQAHTFARSQLLEKEYVSWRKY
ncbi:urease accessory protein UreD [Alkalihalobacillus deserti]|uniref:urease accessory protein UreD n=1 Tax=Alkalihalobacillus deserti TaxID=2879466 RepID=UPI001D13914C|nr:urease accessory protein UreD [Alkalihalobacillus deserti]